MPAKASGREPRYVCNRGGMDDMFDNTSMPAKTSANVIRIVTQVVVPPRLGLGRFIVDIGVIAGSSVDGFAGMRMYWMLYREAFAAKRCIAAYARQGRHASVMFRQSPGIAETSSFSKARVRSLLSNGKASGSPQARMAI